MKSMKEKVAALFTDQYGEPDFIVKSPGRINLIGEHTDYNFGFVLPAAIDKAIYIAISKRKDDAIHLFAGDLNKSFVSHVHSLKQASEEWPNYILGVVDELIKEGHTVGGFNAVIMGDVPLGAGLSSSAAVECATCFALNELFGLGMTKMDMVKTAQKAENEFVGVKCGIMDQFASMFGEKEHVMKLDCRSLEYEYVPFKMNGIRIVLFDTGVKHSLASSAYNQRRQECEAGVALIRQQYPSVQSLRDATMEMVETCLSGKDQNVYHRCKYVVEEISRLQEACALLEQGDMDGFGTAMFATHDGLQKLYEVSCAELDALVDLVRDEPAVAGARMMGGGFGGCTINIVKEEAVESLVERVTDGYHKRFGRNLQTYIVTIDSGTALYH